MPAVPDRSGHDTSEVPAARPSNVLARRLRSLAVPHLEALAARLTIARHRTLVDDRLDAEPAILRFRLIPRPAPFDEPRAVAGSVLELVVDDSEVVARFWIDPLADDPSEERRVPDERLSSSWLEETSTIFVARALRRG